MTPPAFLHAGNAESGRQHTVGCPSSLTSAWSAYLAIPCVLAYFALRRRNLPFKSIFLLFGAFILVCGATHLMDAVIFWWSAYRLAGLLKLITAIVSWATVLALTRIVPKAFAVRSPEELERAKRKQLGIAFGGAAPYLCSPTGALTPGVVLQ